MLKRTLSKVRYAVLLFRLSGQRVFFRQLRSHLYNRVTFIGLEKNLGADNVPLPARIEYTLRLATAEDMEEVYQKAKFESKESAYELLHRKRFYDAGCRNCYVARTTDTNEICHIKWVLTSEDAGVATPLYRRIMSRLNDDDIVVENTFTFEKYRKTRLGASVRSQLAEMAREKGFKRMIGYVSKDNPVALKSFLIDGYHKFEEIYEFRFLILTKRKYTAIETES